MDKIRVSVQDYSEPVSAVRVDGVVDTVTSVEVDRAISALLERRRSQIVMDLAGVDYISSAGWGVFISHLKSARSQAGDVRLSGMIPNVQEIYELLEFDTVLSSYETTQQAIHSFETRERSPEGGPRIPEGSSGGLEELSAIGVEAPASVATARTSDAAPLGAVRTDVDVNGDVESALLRLVAEDPFASIGELRTELNELGAKPPIGWWRVFGILRANGLLRRRARFQLSRRA